MLRRISTICLTLVVGLTAIALDCETADAQGLFRRLRARIQAQTAPLPQAPVQRTQQPVQRTQQQGQPQQRQSTNQPPRQSAATQPRSQGQRVAPVTSQPRLAAPAAPGSRSRATATPNTASPQTRSTAPQRYGNSILAPAAGATQTVESKKAPNAAARDVAAQPRRDSANGESTETRRRSLGIEVAPSTGGIPGLKVVRIKEASQTDEAGLRVGDLIVAVDGMATPTIAAIAEQLSKQSGADTIRARIVRGRETKALTLPFLGSRFASAKPASDQPANDAEPIASVEKLDIGIEVSQAERQRGVFVSKVDEKSAADVAGLKVGDRIVSIDGRLLLAAETLQRELEKRNTGDELKLQVVRNGTLVSADVKLLDPDVLAKMNTQQTKPKGDSVLGGLGSALGGLFGGTSEPTEKPAAQKDEMAFGDDEPIQKVGFESELQEKATDLKQDPPSLESLELPAGVATPIELEPPQPRKSKVQTTAELREEIRRLEEQLKALEADKT